MRTRDTTLDRPAEEGARAVALGLLAGACEAAGDLAAGTGDDPLHDFRVAVRRLRTALRSFRPWLEGSVRAKDARRLKRLARATGAARDAEVQLRWLEDQRGDGAGRGQREGRAFLAARLARQTRAAPDAAALARRFLRRAAALRRRLERCEVRVAPGAGAPAPFRSALARVLREEVAEASRLLAAVGGADDEGGVHAARITAKRLRYLLEPLRDAPGTGPSAPVDRLKTLQQLLGGLHDAHVMAGEVRRALAAATGRARGRDPRPGLLALARAVRDRRDALFAELDRGWLHGGAAALAREAATVADALDPPAPGGRRHPAAGGTAPRGAPVRSSRGRRRRRQRP